MQIRSHLLAQIDAYCRRHGITEAEFGRLAVDDNRLVPRLRDPSVGVTLTVIERAVEFMRSAPPRQPRRRTAALTSAAAGA